jgi:ubiquinone biosynthesis monooxygenase Coq7
MNFVDRLICELDDGLRTVFAQSHSHRPVPKPDVALDIDSMSAEDTEESIRLMRINHCGEVCAQALYQGQALVAKSDLTRDLLRVAAAEERDHLAWCESRLNNLGGHVSRLSPFFYAGSFGLGVASGLLGDRWSMGFLVETERQVEAHLHEHLSLISTRDRSSRVILEAMRDDEIRHGQAGLDHGATPLPKPIKSAMTAFSRLMTRSTYWV